MLLRVPGLGTSAVDRIVAARRMARLRLDDVARLTASLKRARPFLDRRRTTGRRGSPTAPTCAAPRRAPSS